MEHFELVSSYKPMGDQPKAIEQLVSGINKGLSKQTLLGVTGSGKTFTMANVISKLNRPTLVLAHNKTLAGQLYSEFKELFPNNAVEFFVSYYDYYQPEAYISETDTYIEKDSSINDDIDRMRHSATRSLLTRNDVIVVSSVSCIYGIGDREDYLSLAFTLQVGQILEPDTLMAMLIEIQFNRADIDLLRGTFRRRGDIIDIFLPDLDDQLLRISFFGDEIEKISFVDRIKGNTIHSKDYVEIFPASQYSTTREKLDKAMVLIEEELEERITFLRDKGKLVEAYRLEQRTRYDLELLKETGFCKGIENYSRHIAERASGETPCTLMDFFPEDYLLFIDESHVTIPQVGAMYKGDRARKEQLIDYGFRLPSALDNRPLLFEEFEERMGNTIFVSATPAKYEKDNSLATVEQLIRPTGLLEPIIEIKPIEGQIEDILMNLRSNKQRGNKCLIMTLTKKMAEDLTEFLIKEQIRVDYLHSDIDTVGRMEILRKLRADEIDVIVGINLLREGIDLPEVACLMILDADKEGFLRSERSLIQIIGRCARNSEGRVILYADEITDSMMNAISETNRRRTIQEKYNKEHGIVPRTIIKKVTDVFEELKESSKGTKLKNSDLENILKNKEVSRIDAKDKLKVIEKLEKQMKEAAKELDFEGAAKLRDMIISLKNQEA